MSKNTKKPSPGFLVLDLDNSNSLALSVLPVAMWKYLLCLGRTPHSLLSLPPLICPPLLWGGVGWKSLMKIIFLLAEWEIIRLNWAKEEKALNLEGNGYINILINNWFERTEIIVIRKTEVIYRFFFFNYSSVNCFLIKTQFSF